MRQETTFALVNLGMAAHGRGEDALTTERLAEGLSISREIGYLEGVGWVGHELASLTCYNDESAGDLLHDTLETHA